MSKYVLSLGGNALGNTPKEQKDLLKSVAEAMIPLIKDGHDIVIVHGNGPQVGMIQLAFSTAESSPEMPFAECGSMSQGYIGFHIQNALYNAMKKYDIDRSITTLVTQVLVDSNDQAFLEPTKPIGTFYSKEESIQMMAQHGYQMVEDAGRGYRRIIASPKPIDVIEKESILRLLEAQHIVIAGGGGGIPVIKTHEGLMGVDAVIDKDFASAKIAEIIKADALIILTAVENVFLNFNQDNQIMLKEVTINELDTYIKQGHFKKGSMLPKIEASMMFTKHTKKPSVIASLEHAKDAIKYQSGTIIHFN